MASTPNAAEPTAPLSTSSCTSKTLSAQDYDQAIASPAASNPTLTGSLSDSDDDLSDAPESPIDPANLPTTLTISSPLPSSMTTSDSDSDSDLSDVPASPVWPEGPEPPSRAPRCTEQDCPISQALRRHYQGPYRHKGERPLTNETIFKSSNPPLHVWLSWMRIMARDRRSTVEDDWNVLGFLRWHVDDAKPHLVGMSGAEAVQ